MNKLLLSGAAILALTSLSTAQTLTSRSSTINYNAVYGGGGDVFTPNDIVQDSSLVASDSETLSFADSKSGFILNDPNRPWGASVEFDGSHEFQVTGPLNAFTSITAEGRSTGGASASGEGLAALWSENPGNEIQFYFSLAGNTEARLQGEVILNPDLQNLAAGVTLQRFDGIVWQNTFNSLFLAGQEGAFDNNYMLTAGDYRITGWTSVNPFAGARPFDDNSFNYRLDVVPEPATLTVLGLGALVAARRRRKA